MCSPELKLEQAEANSCIEVATPPQFPKGVAGIWSPEHLFTAAISSCFMTTFLAIAEASRLDFIKFHCSAKGKLELIDGKYMMSEVLLEPAVNITNEGDRDKAMRILHKAEMGCLITNSVKTTVVMAPVVTVGVLVA
jgi:organic hydroperoxide reductase OsmC/OhrA